MFETVEKLLKAGVGSYDSHSRKQWAIKHPGQVVLAAVSLHVYLSRERVCEWTSKFLLSV